VLVAVARRDGARCRFLRPSAILSKRRPCSQPLHVPATGLTRWALKAKGDLPRGRYVVWSHAIDTSGNVETRRRRSLTGTLR
jgi:hypothetical protein